MIANVIVALGVGAALAGVVAAASEAALRQARDSFLAARARGAADQAVSAELSTSWPDSTLIAVPGRRVSLGPPRFPRVDTRVELEVRWLARDLWLLSAAASISDAGGAGRAQAGNGIIVQVLVNPIDSTRSARPIARAWVARYQ